MITNKIIWSYRLFALAAVLVVVAFIGFALPYWLPRLFISGRHFWEEICGTFVRLSGGDAKVWLMTPEVGKLQPISSTIIEPDFQAFWDDVVFALRLLVTKESAVMSSMGILDFLLKVLRWVLFLPIIAIVLKFLLGQLFKDQRLPPDHQSAGLVVFRKYIKKPAKAALAWLREAYAYFRQSPLFVPCIAAILIAMNALSIGIDFLGTYLWFFSSFDFLSLLDFIVATGMSIWIGLSWMNPLAWLIVAYAVFSRVRKNMGEQRLRRLAAIDKKVVGESTGVFNLILGKMRASKTTILVSMSRMTDEIYHEDALDNMVEVASLFPNFPFVKLERAIVQQDHFGNIHNRIQCSAFVTNCFDVAASRKSPHFPFGYIGPFFVEGGNVIRDLESCLKIYAESYWLYYHDSPLIAGNIAIRTDGIKIDSGHFPLWDFDSLNRPLPDPASGNMCKILDWNMARLGKKIPSKRDFGLALDGCVLAVSEIAKERGNSLDNAIYKRDDPDANPKNDYFDATLKMGGHLAYVNGKPFFKVISDDQRSGSVGSNLVDVAETIFTVDRKRITESIALPFYWVEPMVLGWLNAKATSFWQRWRNARDDQTLISSFMFWLMGWTHKRLARVYGRYSFKECRMATNTSDSIGNLVSNGDISYFILSATDYAYRFDSASFSGFLNHGKETAEQGFFDLASFRGITATKEEFEMENAYLVQFLNQQKGEN